MKFVDVKNDVAFHKIFGDSEKTISLISFLNAVLELEGTHRIASVTIENPLQFPVVLNGKTSVLDIGATDQQGRKFIVEMQVADKVGFIKRAQYYTARDFSMQINRGEQYPRLRPTHFIGILDFNLTESGYYFSRHKTLNDETGEHLLKDMQYFFIELKKFNKEIHELQNLIDQWTFFIKNAENLTLIPENLSDEGLKTAYVTAEQYGWTAAELRAYDGAGVRITDGIQELAFATQKGISEGLKAGVEQGIEQGMEQGLKQGIEQGIEQGIKQGEDRKVTEAIIGFYSVGVSLEKISLALSVPLDHIEEIIKNQTK